MMEKGKIIRHEHTKEYFLKTEDGKVLDINKIFQKAMDKKRTVTIMTFGSYGG